MRERLKNDFALRVQVAECPLLALSGHSEASDQCPLSGVIANIAID